jgi:octaprenyl-diphosphate synthase
MCEGELFQLADRRVVDLSVDRYLSIIERKTAVLFSTACFSGAIVSGADQDTCESLRAFGRELGFLFQLTDDYLDFFGKDGDLKKELGQDIEQGQMTLPLLLLRNTLSKDDSKHLVSIIREGKKDQLSWIVERMQGADISTQYVNFMSDYVSRANYHLQVLPESKYREALKEVLDFIVQRIVY